LHIYTSFFGRVGLHRYQFANLCDAGIMCDHATLAQSAEQTLRKRQVLGSIPKGGLGELAGKASPIRPRQGAFFLVQQERVMTQTPSALGRRDPWRLVWQTATGDGLLVVLLLAVAVGLLATAWLPQAPTTASNPAAYVLWLSETQARFGEATQAVQALGLFDVVHSFGFRTLLALLGGVLLVRLVERGLRPFSLLAHGGGLLLLIGLLITHLWSWRVEGLIVHSGERASVPGTASWVALDGGTLAITHSAGIAAFVEARGPGARVGATDAQGNPLTIQQTEDNPLTELTLALAEDQRLAIPDAQLIVHMAPQAGHSIEAHTPVLVRVRRYPSLRLETEAVVEGDTELAVSDVRLCFTSVPYARVTATFNPGRWPTGIGIMLTIVGLGGSIVWLARQPRADEEN
jgi:hypothetical protein